jgi:transcriptional regulator with XRE-family HTH domain
VSLSPDDEQAGESFGRLVAARRHQLGLSQQDLADRLCELYGRPTLTRHEVSRYERGVRAPRGWLLEAMATCLDLPLASLRQAIAQRRSEHA